MCALSFFSTDNHETVSFSDNNCDNLFKIFTWGSFSCLDIPELKFNIPRQYCLIYILGDVNIVKKEKDGDLVYTYHTIFFAYFFFYIVFFFKEYTETYYLYFHISMLWPLNLNHKI